MNIQRSVPLLVLVLVLAVLGFAHRQSAQGQPKDQLGEVDFANSCSPGVQVNFQRAVAMLHSFR